MSNLREEIQAYRDAHWDEIMADIQMLVSIASVEDLSAAAPNAPYGPGPRAALDKALEIARRMGLDAHDCEGHIGYADLPGGDTPGEGQMQPGAAQLGIIGHVDVVAAGPGWTVEPYGITQRDGYLLGRGVIDDKGPLMVALHAVKFWKDKGGKLPFTTRVLFGVNEETNMKDVEYYRAHYEDPTFLFTPDSQFPVGYGESGICSGTLVSAPISAGHLLEWEGGQAVNAVPGTARAVVRAGVVVPTRMSDGVFACADTGAPPHADATPATCADAGSAACADAAAGAAAQAGDAAAPSPNYERISVTPQTDGTTLIEAHGISAHAAEPQLGLNAIGLLVDFLLDAGIGTPEERAFFKVLKTLHDNVDGSGFGIACEDEHFGPLSAVGGVARLKQEMPANPRFEAHQDAATKSFSTSQDEPGGQDAPTCQDTTSGQDAPLSQDVPTGQDASAGQDTPTAQSTYTSRQQSQNPPAAVTRLTQSIDFRYPTTVDSAQIEHAIDEAACAAGATFTMEHDKEPFLMDPDSPAVHALLNAYCEVTGEQARGLTSKGGTYARCFAKGVSFGMEKPWVQDPAWVGGMHGPDEGVSVDLLKEAFEIYALAIGNLAEVDL